MKNEIMLIIAIATVLLFSCSKQDTTKVKKNNSHTNMGAMADGEDGDIIILNHKVVDMNGDPIPGAIDTLTNGNKVLVCTTDSDGVCVFYIPFLGIWNLVTVHEGYLPSYATLNIVDSNSTRIDTLRVH